MKSIDEELEQLLQQGNGLLRPESVVEYARDSSTALHASFEWNDGKAAEAYRLQQARQLLRVRMIVIEHEGHTYNVRRFESLPQDRKYVEDIGGYRATVTILRDPMLREQLLQSALAELKLFQSKYEGLTELAQVFQAINKTQPTRRGRPRKLKLETMSAQMP